MMRLRSAVIAALMAACVLAQAPRTAASVAFHEWQDTSFRSACDEAARTKKPIVLIITQPDWCPPCIKLDKRWLKNPADTELRDITKGAIVLEVRGYEADGGRILRREGISFQGTPTVHVFAPPTPKKPLGQATLLGSIVGAPDDFPGQLKRFLAAQGDPLAPLRAAVSSAAGDVARATALLELAKAAAGRGEPAGAESALGQVAELKGTAENAAELAKLRRAAEWQRASVITLRVRKDWKRALEQIDAYAAAMPLPGSPTEDEKEGFAYARAWALVHLGRRDEAVAQLDAALPATVDGADTFLYFCFRSDDAALWTLGEKRAQDALTLHGAEQAVLWQDLGRIQRRLGRLDDAETSFAKAVDLSPPGDDRETYQGQLETVRAERARRP